MNKQIEALKMEIDDARIGLGKVRQYLGWQEPKEDELCLEILKAWKTLDACKEALAQAEKQEVREVMDLASYGQSISRIPAQPLDDDAITAILNEHGLDNVEQAGNHIDVVKLIRDVEIAHGIGG